VDGLYEELPHGFRQHFAILLLLFTLVFGMLRHTILMFANCFSQAQGVIFDNRDFAGFTKLGSDCMDE